jgi:5-methyltetrahydropteroyltriglutamate--homocysteine methyltransferase
MTAVAMAASRRAMTKWFDTNYHYLVPELAAGQKLALNRLKVVDEYREAKAQGFETRPVLLGPVTWLSLAKGRDVDPFDYLDEVLGLYAVILGQLAHAGAEWVQIDEPVLVLDLDEKQRRALTRAYARLSRSGPKLMLTTYFGGLGDNLSFAAALPVAGLHVDLVRAPEQLDAVLKAAPKALLLSLGVVDGRNVWRADLDALLDRLASVAANRDLVLAPSCSLLHVPVDLALETKLDARRVVGLRGAEDRGACHSQARAQRGAWERRRGARTDVAGECQPPGLAACPQSGGRRSHRGRD